MNNLLAESLPFGPGALTFIACYLLALIGLGILGKRASRENSLKDFYLAGRGVGLVVLLFTLFATQYSGNTIIGFTGKASSIGYAWMTSLQFMTAILIGYLLFAPQLYRLAKRESFITPSDYLLFRFRHRGLALLGTLIMVAALGNFFLGQLTAMGRAVEGLTSMDPVQAFAWGVILLAGIMLIYETLGGFRAVAWTDMIQGGILALGFVTLLGIAFSEFGSPAETTARLQAEAPEKVLPPKGILLRGWINYILLLGIGAALYPQAIQRIYAAKDTHTLRRGLAAMSFLPLVSALIVTLVGVTVAAHLSEEMANSPQDTALAVLLRHVQESGLFGYCLVVVIFTAVLGAIMSTGDSALLSISSMLTKDIYAGMINKRASDASLTRMGKVISAVLVVGLTWLAIYLNKLDDKITLIELLSKKFDMLIQLAPAFMIGVHWRGLRAAPTFWGALIGLIFSISVFVPALSKWPVYQWIGDSGFSIGLYGLVINLIIAVGGSLLFRRST